MAMRLWRLTQELHEPLPTFSDDDVLDYMVKEFVMVVGLRAREEAQKAEERRQWKNQPVGSGR